MVMKMKQTKRLIEICFLAQTFCEVPNFELTNNEMKVLFFVEQYSCVSPQVLISKLGLAKSNLALLTKKLVSLELIQSQPSIIDKRAVSFTITQKGKNVVKNFVDTIAKSIRQEDLSQNFSDGLDSIAMFLNKKV